MKKINYNGYLNLNMMEKYTIIEYLKLFKTKGEVANKLGITQKGLRYKIKKHNIESIN